MSVLDWEDWLSIYVNLEAVGLGLQLYPPDHRDFMNSTRIVLTSCFELNTPTCTEYVYAHMAVFETS